MLKNSIVAALLTVVVMLGIHVEVFSFEYTALYFLVLNFIMQIDKRD